jgi:hypothetical protein
LTKASDRMSPRRPTRSTRSYVIEVALILALIAGVHVWLANGGPGAFGDSFAGYIGPP